MNEKKSNNFAKTVLLILGMIIGSLFMAIGVYFFKIPNGFSTGGVSGVATVLSGLTSILTAGQMILIITMALLIVGFVFIGKDTGWKTVFCSLAFSGFTRFFEILIPLKQPLTDQPFLELTYVILLTGIGSAILFSCNASSGGIDIVALILKKYTSLNVGNALLCTDFLIAASAFVVFGVEIGLFSLIGLFAKAFLVDSVIESFNVCKYFVIITQHAEPIVEYVIKDMKRSATTFDAVGEYSHSNRKVIMVLCRRPEAMKLKKKIREVDPGAFLTIQTTSEIVGKGFRTI